MFPGLYATALLKISSGRELVIEAGGYGVFSMLYFRGYRLGASVKRFPSSLASNTSSRSEEMLKGAERLPKTNSGDNNDVIIKIIIWIFKILYYLYKICILWGFLLIEDPIQIIKIDIH